MADSADLENLSRAERMPAVDYAEAARRPRDFCTVAEWVTFWLSRAAPPTADQHARANAALGITTRRPALAQPAR